MKEWKSLMGGWDGRVEKLGGWMGWRSEEV